MPEFVLYIHNQAKDLEKTGSIKLADEFLQGYGQIYLEVCYIFILICGVQRKHAN